LETILIVEDEQDIAEIIAFNLEQAGYHTQTARTGEDALVKVGKFLPDLVILDLMLPGIDGLEICKKFKQDPVLLHIPVLIVTAKSEDNDIICGLEMGADDYITKPFSPRILTARVKTILRRRKIRVDNKQQGNLSLHGIEIDVNKHRARVDGEKVDLSASEYKILLFLIRNPGWVFSRGQLISAVHGEDYPVTDRSIDVQILGLRRKLGEKGTYIETVRGIGYRMKETADDI
jgi:two-component system phosphate regulon response regulator PhoB